MQKTKTHKLEPSFQRSGFILFGIFIFSLLLRFIYLYQLKSSPLFGFLAADSSYYHKIALNILAGDILSKESVYLSPLYPFFISFIYFIFDHSLEAVAYCQILLDSLIVLFLYMISLKIFKRRSIGLLAAFIYAFYSLAIFYTGFLLDVTLVTFINVALILVLLQARAKGNLGLWFLAGILLGLSSLLKATIILFIPFLALWMFYACEKGTRTRSKVTNIIAILVGLIIILAPFSIRNYLIEKRFSPLPLQGGINFYIGNNPDSKGSYMTLYDIPDSPVEQVKASIRRAEKESGEALTPAESSRYWFLRGFKFIKNNKQKYFLLSLRKLFLFWNNGEIPVSLNYDFCKRFLPLLNLPLFSFGFIAPFAIVGFIFAIRQKSREASLVALFIFVYMISLIFFYISSRYRFPCIPFIIIFAAYAIQNFIGLIKTERKKECALFVLLLIGLFFITNSGAATDNSKDTAAVSHNNLGNVYYDRGMWEKAITEYKEAIEQEPGYAEAHFNLGIAYFNKNLEAEAMAEFQSAVRINPAYAEAHNNLAVMYYKRKDMQRAKYHYNKALESGFEENPEFSKLLL